MSFRQESTRVYEYELTSPSVALLVILCSLLSREVSLLTGFARSEF